MVFVPIFYGILVVGAGGVAVILYQSLKAAGVKWVTVGRDDEPKTKEEDTGTSDALVEK